ncbi:MAG: hypothetical protein IID60_05600 [Proteobacteria bacterium]|nr:hypothetical protein [Pseudomonadota bacterium]
MNRLGRRDGYDLARTAGIADRSSPKMDAASRSGYGAWTKARDFGLAFAPR